MYDKQRVRKKRLLKILKKKKIHQLYQERKWKRQGDFEATD